MKNSLLLGAVLLLVGGFALGDAASFDLLARIGGKPERTARSSPTSTVRPTSERVCNDAFKTVGDQYKVAIKAAQEKYQTAVKAKNACMKAVHDATRTPTPSTSTAR